MYDAEFRIHTCDTFAGRQVFTTAPTLCFFCWESLFASDLGVITFSCFFFEPLMTTHQCIMLVWRWSLVHSVVLDKSCCSVSWCAQVCMSCGRQGATRVTPPIRWWTWLPEFLPWSHHGHESTEFRGMFYICFTSACQQVNWLITWPSC